MAEGYGINAFTGDMFPCPGLLEKFFPNVPDEDDDDEDEEDGPDPIEGEVE